MQRLKLKFITWFYSKFPGKYCWADCVSWSYSKKLNPFKIDSSKACKIESIEHPTHNCYCAGWRKGQCFDLLPKEEKERVRNEFKNEVLNETFLFKIKW